ncbi:hypothetical protein C4F40_10760 [Sphingobacterium sp. Ka21]|uniref:KilA-N DNA-binding domain-containing protein n=1 Tax=Sphingobacterium pedocola TaxID=2082722 RepID=A0ABR9T7Z3_9SPHI|nr:hypothetical protein [Sphingobacterium pedocola]
MWDLKLEERERIDWLKGRDRDLAELYGVETKQLKRQVRRNIDRFPHDFMFELSKEAHEILRSQIGTLGHGEHAKYIPMVFGEYYSHGGPKLRRSVTVLRWRHILWTWHN